MTKRTVWAGAPTGAYHRVTESTEWDGESQERIFFKILLLTPPSSSVLFVSLW
jgi:hypothetical protein